jgi:hypothetical protein
MLECGAVYRGLPPHALAFSDKPEPWTLEQAQVWNCYGDQFSTIEYDFLSGLRVETIKKEKGRYLFTVVPLSDPYTSDPAQSKEFMFCKMDNGRLCVLPTNHILFEDKSFTKMKWPQDIALSNKVWRVESEGA